MRKPQPVAVLVAQRPDGQLAGIVERIQRDLFASRIDLLAEISLLIQQADANHRHAQIVRRLELIAGHVSQTARINRQRFADSMYSMLKYATVLSGEFG